MTNVFLYYNFNPFFKDESNAFNGNDICYTELNTEHFLIFEQINDVYNLYVAKYGSKNEIGKTRPIILETLVKSYNKSIPEHRIILRQYLE